jgi:hypothetical protein
MLMMPPLPGCRKQVITRTIRASSTPDGSPEPTQKIDPSTSPGQAKTILARLLALNPEQTG